MSIATMLDSFNYPKWHDDALCSHPDYHKEKGWWWFPRSKREERLAKLVCNECPVKQKCLDWIREIERVDQKPAPGIFGGLTEEERRKTKLCTLKGCSNSVSHPRIFCSEEHKRKHNTIVNANARHYTTFKVRKYGQ